MTECIESRFLELTCGTGNFLAEILERKLRVVEKCYAKSQIEYYRYAVLTTKVLDVITKGAIMLYRSFLKSVKDCRRPLKGLRG
jgi:hypothetical protein